MSKFYLGASKFPIFVCLGLAGIFTISLYFKWPWSYFTTQRKAIEPKKELVIQTTEKAKEEESSKKLPNQPEPKPAVNDASSDARNSGQPEQEQKPKEKLSSIASQDAPKAQIFYAIELGDEDERSFSDWELAKTELMKREVEGLTVSVEFSANIITKHHDEAYFKNWVIRLGEYIFAQRVVLIKKMGNVIRNADLVRGDPCDGQQRGCALFQTEDQKFKIIIRGLGKHPKEIVTIVEEIIHRAFENPKSIANCSPIKFKNMSAYFKALNKQITKNQTKLVDDYVTVCTLEKAMTSKGVTNNSGAFLPLVSFE